MNLKQFFVFLWLTSHFLNAAVVGLEPELRRDGPVIKKVLDPVQKSLQDHSAVFYDAKTRKYFVYGTVMSADGLILTKASELAKVEKFTVRVGRKHYRNPELLEVDHRWDLALVKVPADDLKPAKWGETEALDRGTWVICNGSTDRKFRRPRIGVIAATEREIPGPPLVALGVRLETKDGAIHIGPVSEASGAHEAGVKEGDIILSIDGEQLKKHEELIDIVKERVPGDQIAVELKRDDEKISTKVELYPYYKVYPPQSTRNDHMSGLISDRRTSFPRVIQHDIFSSYRNMGGPLVTLDGVCVGMNIACVSRVTKFAIPAEELQVAFEELKAKAFNKEGLQEEVEE